MLASFRNQGPSATDLDSKSRTDYSVFFDKQFCHVTPEGRRRHLRKHLKYLVYELIALSYIAFITHLFVYDHDRSDGKFKFDNFTLRRIPIECRNKTYHRRDCNYDNFITSWLIVLLMVYILFFLRRVTILCLWFFKTDPHKQEMILNATYFGTVYTFECCWYLFFQS